MTIKIEASTRLLAATKTIKNKYGRIEYNWKSNLEDEEGDGYIPKGYSKKVLELAYLEASELGVGYGAKLMHQFLALPEAQKAELIFCDPNPGEGLFKDSKDSYTEQLAKLIRFYQKFGFRHAPKSSRMWLVQKGSIPTNELPA